MPDKAALPVRARTTAAFLVAAALALAAPGAARAETTAATVEAQHLTGVLPDGATWIADLPAQGRWNGTLLLFSHGFGPAVAQDAPSGAARDALLAEGYALAG